MTGRPTRNRRHAVSPRRVTSEAGSCSLWSSEAAPAASGRGARQRAGGRLDPVEKIGTMESVAALGAADSEPVWAKRISRRLLKPLRARLLHTIGVAERSRVVGGVLKPDEAELLLAAAYLHDVGYAPELTRTGFHPLDGARFVRACGHERLSGLIAYHSGAAIAAAERGLVGELSEFHDERSVVSRALTYCDLTTDPDGRPVEPRERLTEIRERFPHSTAEARALEHSIPALLDDVRRVELMLSERKLGAPALAVDGAVR